MRTEIDVLSEIMCSNVSERGCASCKHEPTCFVRKFAERAIKAGYAQCGNRDIRREAAERALSKLMSFIGCMDCPCDKVICDRSIVRDPKQVERGYPACTANMLKLCSMEIEREAGNSIGGQHETRTQNL